MIKLDYSNYLSSVNKFLMDAKEGLYNKKEYKLKWKSIVIRYIKVLSSIKEDDENFNLATDLLYRLFMLLEQAKLGKIFITTNPFRDVNIDEVTLYQGIMKRYFVNYDNMFTDRFLKDIIDLSIINKRFLLWPVYIYSLEMKKIDKLLRLWDKAGDNYLQFYREFKKNNTNQLYLEYLSLNMVIMAYLANYLRKGIGFYYSYSILDKKDAFDLLFDISSVFEDKQLFLYVYEDGLSRRIKPTDEQKAEYEELKIKK